MRCVQRVLLIRAMAAIVAVIEDPCDFNQLVAWMVDTFKKNCKYSMSNYMLASYDMDI